MRKMLKRVLTPTNYVLNYNHKLNLMSFRKAGEKMEGIREDMNTKEMSLAAEWLKVHGHTDAEVLEFLDFIAQKPVKAEKPKE